MERRLCKSCKEKFYYESYEYVLKDDCTNPELSTDSYNRVIFYDPGRKERLYDPWA